MASIQIETSLNVSYRVGNQGASLYRPIMCSRTMNCSQMQNRGTVFLFPEYVCTPIKQLADDLGVALVKSLHMFE